MSGNAPRLFAAVAALELLDDVMCMCDLLVHLRCPPPPASFRRDRDRGCFLVADLRREKMCLAYDVKRWTALMPRDRSSRCATNATTITTTATMAMMVTILRH